MHTATLLSTREVAAKLDISPQRLYKAVWDGRLSAPPKMLGNSFAWGDDDIDRACRLFHHRDLESFLGRNGGRND